MLASHPLSILGGEKFKWKSIPGAVIQLFYDREGVLRSEQSVHFTYIRPHLEKESICDAMFQTLTCLLQNVPYSPFQQFQNPCLRCNYIISHSFALHEFGLFSYPYPFLLSQTRELRWDFGWGWVQYSFLNFSAIMPLKPIMTGPCNGVCPFLQ